MKKSTTKKSDRTKIRVRDLKPVKTVKGGNLLTDACATGKHINK